jgi:hypothetical protein
MATEQALVARRKKMFVLAREIGLTRDERLALSEILLRRDIQSWKDLDDDQVVRVLDALEGWQLIDALLSQRPPITRDPGHP